LSTALTAQPLPPVQARFGIEPVPVSSSAGRVRVGAFIVGAVMLAAGGISPTFASLGVFLIVIAFAFPSRQTVHNRVTEQHRRAVQEELDRRLARVKLVAERDDATADQLRATLKLIETLELDDADFAPGVLEGVRARAELLDLEERARSEDGLPVVPGHERVLESEPCFFVASAVYDKRGDDDPTGTLYLYSSRSAAVTSGDCRRTTPCLRSSTQRSPRSSAKRRRYASGRK